MVSKGLQQSGFLDVITTISRRPICTHWLAKLLLVWTLLCGLCLRRVWADERDLTSLLSGDVGACVEVRDLRKHLHDVPSAEWFRRLRELSLVKRWQQGPEFARWQVGQASLTALVGQPLDQFVAELFGESVVVAISPTKAGPPQAVLLSRAAKDDTWDRVLVLWDQMEDHDVQTRSALGRSFQLRRKKTNGSTTGPDLFTVKLGRTLAISDREEPILDVIARAVAPSDASLTKPLGQTPEYLRAMSALPESCAVRVFVNPRRWDEELAKDLSAAEWLMPLWRRLEWLSAGLELREGLIAHTVVHHETDRLPSVWQKFVEASQTSSDLSARLPANAVLVGETRIAPDLLSWLRTLDDSEKARRDWQTFGKVAHGVLGRDLFADVLTHARPSFGGAIVPKRPVEERSAPVDGLLAWQYDLSNAPATTDGQPSLRGSLDGALLTLLNFAAVSHNSRNPEMPAILHVEHRDSLTLKWLDRLPPYRPAFGIAAEHLLLATDPTLISEFHRGPSDSNALNSEPLFAAVRSRHFAEHSHWLFVNSRVAREFLVEQHEPLSRQVAHWRRLAPPSVAAQLNRVGEILKPFDAAFLAAKVSPGEIRFTAGVVTPDLRP